MYPFSMSIECQLAAVSHRWGHSPLEVAEKAAAAAEKTAAEAKKVCRLLVCERRRFLAYLVVCS